VLAFVVLGAYALSFNIFSMLLLLVFGAIGYFMQEFDFPLAPAVLALVLEPLLETNLRRALDITGGDLSTFVTRPASLVLVVVCLAAAVLPAARALRNRGAAAEAVPEKVSR
jgi:putative tricarboxylic transport membrane protein